MTEGSVVVAVCQFAPTRDRESNRARVAALATEAAERGARVIVLPEYASYFVDPLDGTLGENAESLDGPFVRSLHALAVAHDVILVAGVVERAETEGRVHNTVVAVAADGIRARYRKQHLYDAFGQTESDWIAAGETGAAETFEAGGLRFGVMTCYDLRFPEVARTLADAGAEVILVPAEWVRGPLKERHWTTLLAARAIENTAYVVAADHPGPIGVGLSAVVDPQGVTVAGIGAGEGVAFAVLTRAAVERTREVNPALRLRRYRVVPDETGH
ncbi:MULTISPECIES: carbon-nitrogen hydrolase family protein [Bacteria]|uniref:carbon-nitrogen hydrolase family protein n=1 Tax=Bacteria TaxID=2 RepID=UPI003C7B2B65